MGSVRDQNPSVLIFCLVQDFYSQAVRVVTSRRVPQDSLLAKDYIQLL